VVVLYQQKLNVRLRRELLMLRKCNLLLISLFFIGVFFPTTLMANLPVECGSLANNYGPFDYANPKHRAENLRVVEVAHFTVNVERLVSGSSGTLEGDLDYTLRAFPNHHRALVSFSNLERIKKRTNPHYKPRYYSVDCYFLRAIANAPEDSVVYLLYGIYNARLNLSKKSEKNYLKSIAINNNSPTAHYNLGLLYYKLDRYDESLVHAKIAYEHNYPLPALRRKLEKSGHWN